MVSWQDGMGGWMDWGLTVVKEVGEVVKAGLPDLLVWLVRLDESKDIVGQDIGVGVRAGETTSVGIHRKKDWEAVHVLQPLNDPFL